MISMRKKKRISKNIAEVGHLDKKSIRIRMYRVGFGDCFLLSIPTAKDPSADKQQHILIDCGVHSRGDIDTIEKVVKNIGEVTNKKLSVIIATHAHQDHISGFNRFRDLFNKFKVGEVWLPWTWDENNEKALKIQRIQAALTAQLSQHFEALGMNASKSVLHAIENLSLSRNKQAIELLKSGFGNNEAKVYYLKAGDILNSEDTCIPGLLVRILGPPESEEFLAKMNPPSTERYLRMVEGKADTANVIVPFEQRWRVDEKKFKIPLEKDEEKQLQDYANLSLDDLAFSLDHARNNESLVILFIFQNQHLLFAGDAQYGNWKSWLENEQSHDILTKINFFKVAHHGSHNATPKAALERMSDGEFAAMVSTQSEPWDVIPRDPLMARLDEKTKKKIVRSDWLPIKGAPKPITDSKPPSPTTMPKGFRRGDLWFDYTIKLW
jgi:beta-lactamase superfamily II metal-dependent hydrolase